MVFGLVGFDWAVLAWLCWRWIDLIGCDVLGLGLRLTGEGLNSGWGQVKMECRKPRTQAM